MAHPKGGYKLPDGSRVPGVTTVCGAIKDSGPLLWWAFEQGKAAERGEISSLYDKRDEAAEIGTAVHGMVERHINGEDITFDVKTDSDRQIALGFEAYLKWESMTNLEITHQEIQLVCPKYRFGGCPDAIGIIEGEPCLIDWKTSKGVYADMLLQLAAYNHLIKHGLMMEHGYKPLGIEVKGFHLCKFSKTTGGFSHHYWPDLSLAWEQFKDALRIYSRSKMLKDMAS